MAPSVFISYSHDSDEHRARVLALTDRLRADGIDATFDRCVMHPPQGWPKWAQQQIAEADFTLLVCTPNYRRRFEGDDPRGSDNAGADGRGGLRGEPGVRWVSVAGEVEAAPTAEHSDPSTG